MGRCVCLTGAELSCQGCSSCCCPLPAAPGIAAAPCSSERLSWILPGIVSYQIRQLNRDCLIPRLNERGGMEGGKGTGQRCLFSCLLALQPLGTVVPNPALWGQCPELHQAGVCSESTSCKIRVCRSNLSAAAAQVSKNRLEQEPVSILF